MIKLFSPSSQGTNSTGKATDLFNQEAERFDRTKIAQWKNFIELRQIFPSADQVENLTVFNISGNKYRLIALVDYTYQKVFIRHILTHAEYDTDNWKKDSWYSQ